MNSFYGPKWNPFYRKALILTVSGFMITAQFQDFPNFSNFKLFFFFKQNIELHFNTLVLLHLWTSVSHFISTANFFFSTQLCILEIFLCVQSHTGNCSIIHTYTIMNISLVLTNGPWVVSNYLLLHANASGQHGSLKSKAQATKISLDHFKLLLSQRWAYLCLHTN